jgi:hypothetical protein
VPDGSRRRAIAREDGRKRPDGAAPHHEGLESKQEIIK